MNTLATLAWHITKKDLNASRDLVIMGVLLTILETLLRTVWPPFTMSLDPDKVEWVNQVKNMLPIFRSLIFAKLVAQVVHADPLASADAFWLTRPISRGTLFASKLCTILLAIVLPALLAQVAPMIAFGVPPLDVMRLLAEYMLYFAGGLLMVFAAAAITPNGRALVAWAAALGIVWAVATILMVNASTPNRIVTGSTARRAHRSTGLSHSAQIAAFLVMWAGSGAVAWHQYRTRRTGRSVMIAAATAVIVIGVPQIFGRGTVEAIPSVTDIPAVPLGDGMRFKEGPRTIVMWPLGDRVGQCGVMVRATQTFGFGHWNTPPSLSYRFVHRPTGKGLVFTYFALPDRTREWAAGNVPVDAEAREMFQIFYRYVVVGPMFAPDDPFRTEIKGVSCRDIDVVVRH